MMVVVIKILNGLHLLPIESSLTLKPVTICITENGSSNHSMPKVSQTNLK